ncbi:MAG TPA: oligoendopeptidase F [Bacteroidales bacterium]|nr:oligoendopeptidase F [Bacteroidales bacterium]
MKRNFIKNSILLMVTIALSLANSQDAVSQKLERSQVDPKYKWKLEDLYASDEQWQKAKESVKADIDKFDNYKGKLNSAKGLLDFLNFSYAFDKEFSRVYVYASMKSDQDVRESKYLAMKQELGQIMPVISAKVSFAEPEILGIGKEAIDRFLADEKGLAVYKMYLHELFRKQEHLLSEKEEKIMALSSSLTRTPQEIYNVFANAEFPYPEVTLSSGEKVVLNQSGYSRYRVLPNQADRELVFNSFWTAMAKYQRTMAEQLRGHVNGDIFVARARNYNSALESALNRYNIPVSVYHSLVENVNKNLPVFHRYLALRKRMLGLQTLKYSDMYVEPVKGLDLKYTYDEAQKLIIESLQPLGKEYQAIIQKAFNERWLDVYPTEGKRSGAYSQGGAYDVHPYMLLNYNDQYNDVSTTTHELGHTMQSYLSNKAQPYPLADYPIFTAEVASTFNEALLSEYMVNKIKNDNVRLSLLMSRLDGFKGTLFRQTQFAEFELAIHEKAEAGEPLTNEVLNIIYGDILRKYYGHDKGVCQIDDLYSVEWSYIPHFYYNFYVYQYATSFTASSALAEKVLSKEKGAVEKYLAFLSAGGSEYPIDLLKKAGVDMTTSEPFDKAIASMNKVMDEVEAILKKQGK